MMSWIPDAVIAVLILGLTYALSSEGLWGAALMFFNVLFAGMIAFNFYEPLAALIDTTGVNWGMSDTICLIVLFSVSVLILRLTTEHLAPTMVRFPTPVYHIGRLVFGLAASVVTIAILTLAFKCARCAEVPQLQAAAPLRPGHRSPLAGVLPVLDGLHFRRLP